MLLRARIRLRFDEFGLSVFLADGLGWEPRELLYLVLLVTLPVDHRLGNGTLVQHASALAPDHHLLLDPLFLLSQVVALSFFEAILLRWLFRF